MIRSTSTCVRKPPDSVTALIPRCIEAVSPPSVCASGTKTSSSLRARLEDRSGVVQLVRPQRKHERACDRDGDHRRPGQLLRRLPPRLEVEADDLAVEPERLLPSANRVGVVLAREPLHGRILT